MQAARRLDQQDIVALDKVSGCDYLRAIFAAWRAGDLVLPVTAGVPLPNIGLPVRERIAPSAGGGWFDERLDLDDGDGAAQISMTSGTTGEPKAILLSRRALADVTTRLTAIMAMDQEVREYVGVPVTYSFGLGRARAIATVGGKAYLPPAGFRADEFAAMLKAGEVNSLSAVPTLLRLLLAQRALFADCGAHLRWLEIGSQYMSGAEKQQVRDLFPNARIVQHYGLTEASRSTFLRIDGASLDALESVGSATGDVRIKIDEDGLICITGPHVADGRIVDGAVVGMTDSGGWLHTSDRGTIENGLLFYQGRADDVLNVSGVKVSAEHFERKLLEQVEGEVNKVAVTGRVDPLRGQGVLVAYLPEVDRASLATAAHAAASEAGLGAADVTLVEVSELPRTETGKVQRNRLTELYGQGAPADHRGAAPVADPHAQGMSDREREVAAIWQETLGIGSISRDDSFFEIGGDSLSAITVALTAEQRGMPKEIMALMFEGRTIAEIAAALEDSTSIPKRSDTALMGDTINAARGLLVLLVIAGHWTPAVLGRLGDLGLTILSYADLLFHMGTPGFAMVFGVGISFFYMPAFDRAPERVWRKIVSNTALLGGGVAAIAILNAVLLALQGGFGPIWPEQVFFTVILSYFLVMPTVPVILRVIRWHGSVPINALILSVTALLALLAFQQIRPDDLTGFANLASLMLVTPYSYPQMLAAISIGIAIGYWLRANADNAALIATCCQAGLLCAAGGVLLLLYTGGFWAHPREPQFFLLYAGLLLLAIAALRHVIDMAALRVAVRSLILVGLLSFPAYVGHGMVIPLKDVIVALGVPYAAALALSLGLFLVAAFYAITRLKRIYYPAMAAKTAAVD